MTLGLEPRSLGTTPLANDRVVSVDLAYPNGLPPDTLTFETARGRVALTCPVSGVPMTAAMARAAELDAQSIERMINRECPLGIELGTWQHTQNAVQAAIAMSNDDLRPLSDGRVQVAVGGSSIAGFSSRATALGKKKFPQCEAELVQQIQLSPLNNSLPKASLEDVTRRSIDLYRSMNLSRFPVAPWSGILHRLGIEGPPDVDIQLHSDVIDDAMIQRAVSRPGILERQRRDRLGRWDPTDVYSVFPAVAQLSVWLKTLDAPVEIEILGPGGDKTIATRSDWWPIATASKGGR
jgi:hypothetical protein